MLFSSMQTATMGPGLRRDDATFYSELSESRLRRLDVILQRFLLALEFRDAPLHDVTD
jgi:hypothetical protein